MGRRGVWQGPWTSVYLRGPRRSGASVCKTGHYRCPTCTRPRRADDADNGVPACQIGLVFPLFPPSAEETWQQAAHSFIHSSSRPSVSPSHADAHLAADSARSNVIASGRQTQRRRPAAGSIKEWWSVCVGGVECVCFRGADSAEIRRNDEERGGEGSIDSRITIIGTGFCFNWQRKLRPVYKSGKFHKTKTG